MKNLPVIFILLILLGISSCVNIDIAEYRSDAAIMCTKSTLSDDDISIIEIKAENNYEDVVISLSRCAIYFNNIDETYIKIPVITDSIKLCGKSEASFSAYITSGYTHNSYIECIYDAYTIDRNNIIAKDYKEIISLNKVGDDKVFMFEPDSIYKYLISPEFMEISFSASIEDWNDNYAMF